MLIHEYDCDGKSVVIALLCIAIQTYDDDDVSDRDGELRGKEGSEA